MMVQKRNLVIVRQKAKNEMVYSLRGERFCAKIARKCECINDDRCDRSYSVWKIHY